jgi:cell division protein FtsL
MEIVRRSLAVCLAVLFMVQAAGAQDHVITRDVLDKAIQQRVNQEQADRETIVSLLQRSEVREIAAKAGLSLDKAQAAVSMLQGKDLQQAAQQARQVENDLAGGSTTVVISTTTIIIVLLIIILIVVIAK